MNILTKVMCYLQTQECKKVIPYLLSLLMMIDNDKRIFPGDRAH